MLGLGIALSMLACAGCGGAAPTLPAPPTLPPCTTDLRAPHDTLRIFLLTMPPGAELWSVFGHNALWVSKPGGAGDRVYNFGVIDGRRPDLLSGFLEGTLDYLLGTRSVDSMLAYYGRRHRQIAAQLLALPGPAATALVERLEDEARPEHRSYRYHWTDRNCATRVRDLLDEVLDGQLAAQHRGPSGVTARDEVLRHLGPHPLLWFGWHFVVSAAADQPLDRWRRIFLPDRLYHVADASTLRDASGHTRPLVAERCELLAGDYPWPPTAPPQRDLSLWLIGLALAGAVCGASRWAARGKVGRAVFASLIAALGLVGGALGSVSAWLWANSELAGFHGSLNLLVANPATFGLLLVALSATSRRRPLAYASRWITRGLAALALLALILTPWVTQPIAGPVGLFAPALVTLTLCHSTVEAAR